MSEKITRTELAATTLASTAATLASTEASLAQTTDALSAAEKQSADRMDTIKQHLQPELASTHAKLTACETKMADTQLTLPETTALLESTSCQRARAD